MAKSKTSLKSAKTTGKSKGKLKRLHVNGEHNDLCDIGNAVEAVENNENVNTVLKKKKVSNKAMKDTYCNEETIVNEDLSDEHQKECNNVSTLENPSWADAMQKILKTSKPKRKKSIVLSKAKKLQDVKQKCEEDDSLIVDKTENESVKELENIIDKDDESLTEVKTRRKDISLGIRVKPSFADRERERMLQKIATKGVVQLFNAVKEQQTEITKKLLEAGPLERKREKVLKDIDKNKFLDVLMGGAKSVDVKNPKEPISEKDNDTEDKMWSVLRDDFVMGAKLKDWDKKSDSGNDSSSASEDMDSDE